MKRTEDLLQEVQRAYFRLKEAEAKARFAYEHYLDDLKETYAQDLQKIEAVYRQGGTQAKVTHQSRLADAEATFEEAEQQVEGQLTALPATFRWIISSWDEPVWDEYEPLLEASIPSALRIGRLAVGEEMELLDLPALGALIGQGHFFIEGQGEMLPDARQLLETLLLRLILTFPPGTLRLKLADSAGLGNNLSAFLHLPDSLRGNKICSRSEEIRKQLDALEKLIETVNQDCLRNLYSTIEEYNHAQAGQMEQPYHILALTDFPTGFNDQMAERLLHIAHNGPRAGVYIVATISLDDSPPRNFNLDDLTSLGTTLRLTAPDRLEWDDPEFGHYPVVPDLLPPAERVNEWLEAVKKAFEQRSTVVPFSRLAIPERDRWRGNSTDGLRIAIGVNSQGEGHQLEFGKGVVHHGLVGGQIGSGKTNLLEVVINQLALRYPPEELELYLVDFREGVAFQAYQKLPHARVVALESEREFGLSILRRLKEEMARRGKLYKAVGAGKLKQYRAETGKRLPRILLIIDEFQVLFSEDDAIAREAGKVLEDIVRRSREFGIHVILSSQSPSIQGMYSKRIYNQMAMRMAFRCRPQDAQAILGEGNDGASELEKAGEAIYNDRGGRKERNQSIRVALIEPQERRQVLATMQALAQDKAYPAPVTFEGQTPARLEQNPALKAALLAGPSSESEAQAWLGEPIEIKAPTAATLERAPGSNLLIVGSKESAAYGLLIATLLSLAAQKSPPDARFLIADFAKRSSPFYGRLTSLKESLPHQIEVAGHREVGTMLNKLLPITTERLDNQAPTKPDIYFFIAGLRGWRQLRAGTNYAPNKVSQQLERLAEEGAEVGVHLIIWTDSLATLDRALKRGAVNHFDLRVALHLSEKESNDLLGNKSAARLQPNRAYFRHEEWPIGQLEKFKPYAVPADDLLADLVEQIRAKSPASSPDDMETGEMSERSEPPVEQTPAKSPLPLTEEPEEPEEPETDNAPELPKWLMNPTPPKSPPPTEKALPELIQQWRSQNNNSQESSSPSDEQIELPQWMKTDAPAKKTPPPPWLTYLHRLPQIQIGPRRLIDRIRSKKGTRGGKNE